MVKTYSLSRGTVCALNFPVTLFLMISYTVGFNTALSASSLFRSPQKSRQHSHDLHYCCYPIKSILIGGRITTLGFAVFHRRRIHVVQSHVDTPFRFFWCFTDWPNAMPKPAISVSRTSCTYNVIESVMNQTAVWDLNSLPASSIYCFNSGSAYGREN
jgi:hypothetical protein